MQIRKFLVFVSLTFICFFLYSEKLSVVYLDGIVEIKTKYGWEETDIGNSISVTDTIRISKGSLVELSTSKSIITISRVGIYKIKNLIQTSATISESKFGSLVMNKIDSLLKQSQNGRSAVMGVRGAIAEDSDIRLLVNEGFKYIKTSNYNQALEHFDEAMTMAEESEESDIYFFKAYAYSLMGKTRLALDELAEIRPSSITPYYYDDVIILQGKLLIETFAYEKAISWLATYDRGINTDKLNPESRQTVEMLRALCYKGLALSSLKKSIEINPATKTGGKAAELLKQLQ